MVSLAGAVGTGGKRLELDHRVKASGVIVVSVRGHLGDQSADYARGYLEDLIGLSNDAVHVRLTRTATCDVTGVLALVMAASHAARLGRPFLVTGRVTLLRQTMAAAGSGRLRLRWPIGGRLDWVGRARASRPAP